ncbi:dihydrofolate reductase family protein [Actinoplanes sp. TRM 88003]|uniref:Dihydrofolate reductase family protein n=1 Tax=Paractinoplanes aksuensis TaxID=2939490 RepID=A0ABT1DET7_9ACTN|nr:dihydrofolate reductase family protein [Actinoplanes aksuensis]MCO8269333.1 dihydrofolate reductase family protein [Actinoplanes aksuensis]
MRKIVLYSLVSLDGVAENPDQFVFEFDETMDANLADVIGSQDTVLLGRRQYEEWASYWPTAEHEPFASFINSVPKYVFTSAPLPAGWTNTTVVPSDTVEFVRDLKNGAGGEIGVHGSLSLARSLLAAGLIDQIRLVVYPTLAGSGRKLLDDAKAVQKLKLQRAESTPSGGLLLDYEFARP